MEVAIEMGDEDGRMILFTGWSCVNALFCRFSESPTCTERADQYRPETRKHQLKLEKAHVNTKAT